MNIHFSTIVKKYIVLLLFFSTNLYSQSNLATENIIETPFIEVNGKAEQWIIPDRFFLEIRISEEYKSKVKISLEEQEEKLISLITKLGIPKDRLSLSDANSGYVRIKRKTKDVLTRKEYILEIHDTETLSKAFQAFDEFEITDVSIQRVTHSQMDELVKEVKILAIKAAKNKADYLLNAVGEKTGKPIVIKEIMPETNNIVRMRSNISAPQGFFESNKLMDVSFEKIKIESMIYAKFSIL